MSKDFWLLLSIVMSAYTVSFILAILFGYLALEPLAISSVVAAFAKWKHSVHLDKETSQRINYLKSQATKRYK